MRTGSMATRHLRASGRRGRAILLATLTVLCGLSTLLLASWHSDASRDNAGHKANQSGISKSLRSEDWRLNEGPVWWRDRNLRKPPLDGDGVQLRLHQYDRRAQGSATHATVSSTRSACSRRRGAVFG